MMAIHVLLLVVGVPMGITLFPLGPFFSPIDLIGFI